MLLVWQLPHASCGAGQVFFSTVDGLAHFFLLSSSSIASLLHIDRPLVNPVASPRLSEQESIASLTVPIFHQQYGPRGENFGKGGEKHGGKLKVADTALLC